MIDVQSEHLLTMSQAAKAIPGGGIHISTLWRWRIRGIHGVKLETATIGGKRMTSREALARFFAATTAAANGEPIPTRTPRQRADAIRRAEKSLKREGI